MLSILRPPLALLHAASLGLALVPNADPIDAPAGTPQEAAEEAAAQAVPEPLPLPESAAAAVEMREELAHALEGRDPGELRQILEAWMGLAAGQRAAVDAARAAPAGSPENQAANQLQAELDVLVSGAEMIARVIAETGEDVQGALHELATLRQGDTRTLEASTAPETLGAALQLDVEVLRAQLRPLRRDQVSKQLEAWLELLQQSCLAVRNVELAALQADDAATVQADSERAIQLRGERARLIERILAVIEALEAKGGDATEARAYVKSVVVTPAITGLRAAWATTLAWFTADDGGLATGLALAKAVGVLVAFWVLSRLLARLTRRAVGSLRKTSALLREFFEKSVGRITFLLGILVAFSFLGLDMTPLIAAIGAAGLVIGLALQGTLGNLASGLMIMAYRPFDIGNVIVAAGVTGKVEGMTLMTTTVKTFDNQTIHVPNSSIWGDVITNVTANDVRRVDLVIGVGYSEDVDETKRVLQEIVTGHPKVLDDPAPNIRVHELADSSVNLIVRPWTRTDDYWEVWWDLTEAVKKTFDAKGISIPFPQRDVHLIPVSAEERDSPTPSAAEDPRPIPGEEPTA